MFFWNKPLLYLKNIMKKKKNTNKTYKQKQTTVPFQGKRKNIYVLTNLPLPMTDHFNEMVLNWPKTDICEDMSCWDSCP